VSRRPQRTKEACRELLHEQRHTKRTMLSGKDMNQNEDMHECFIKVAYHNQPDMAIGSR
jgi:hypothetical protein